MSTLDLQNCDQSGHSDCAAHAGEEKRWIVDRLKALIPDQDEYLDSISIEPFRGLLKIHTSDGVFFFKPLRDIHKHEQKLVCLLARLHTSNFPEVIGADDEKGWLLMRDVGGNLLDDLYETRYFEETIYNFAKIQTETVRQAAALLACGCPDYRLESLALNIESFFEDLSIWEVHDNETDHIREQIDLLILKERLIERSERVKEDKIPPTLCHGDLNLGNIFFRHGQYVFIDWAEGYVGHPFFTPLEYFNIVKRDRGAEMANIPALRAAYLKPWSETLQLDVSYLIKLLDISRPLGMLRIAMRAWQYYTNVEAIREDPVATVAHVRRIWNTVQRMCKVLDKGGV